MKTKMKNAFKKRNFNRKKNLRSIDIFLLGWEKSWPLENKNDKG